VVKSCPGPSSEFKGTNGDVKRPERERRKEEGRLEVGSDDNVEEAVEDDEEDKAPGKGKGDVEADGNVKEDDNSCGLIPLPGDGKDWEREREDEKENGIVALSHTTFIKFRSESRRFDISDGADPLEVRPRVRGGGIGSTETEAGGNPPNEAAPIDAI